MRRSALNSGKGRIVLISSADNSYVSGSSAIPRLIAASSSGECRVSLILLMFVDLPVVRPAKANNSKGPAPQRKTHAVNMGAEQPKPREPLFTITPPRIYLNTHRVPVEP